MCTLVLKLPILLVLSRALALSRVLNIVVKIRRNTACRNLLQCTRFSPAPCFEITHFRTVPCGSGWDVAVCFCDSENEQVNLPRVHQDPH